MEKETTDKDGTIDLARLPARQKLYTELGSDDVLLGRGTGPNEFEGNIRFRRLVGEVAMATDPKGLVSNKPALARKVVDQVAKRGGRFVRKLSKGEVLALANTTPINKRKDLYVEVPHAVAIEKAKQSFRHQEKILLDRRADDRKGVVVGTPLAPAALSIRDDRLERSSKSSQRVDCMEQKEDVEIRLNAGSSSMMMAEQISSTQHSSLETMSRREQRTASIPSSLMEYSNVLSQSLAWQTLPMDATSFLSAQQQQSARFTGPQNPTLVRSSAFSQVRPGILDPSSLIYTPQSLGLANNASSMDLLNEVSRRHELASLLASTANSTTPQALPSHYRETRIGDAASQQQELHQIQSSASILELLHDYYSPVVPPSPLATTSWATSPPLPLPSWSTSALLQNSSLVLGLMGGSGGTSLTGAGSMDHSLTNSIMQQQLQQQQILLASLVGGTSGLSQDSSGGGFLGGPLGLQDSSSAGGRVLEAVTESLRLGAAADPTAAPAPAAGTTTTTTTTTVAIPALAPLSNVGTDGSRGPPSSAHQSSSVPSETDSNDLADEQQASLLEYILRLRRS